MRNNTRKLIIVLIIILCISTVWAIRYVTLNDSFNAKYGRPRILYDLESDIPLGENMLERNVTADGYVLKFGGIELITPAELVESYNIPDDALIDLDTHVEYLLLIPVTVKNLNNVADALYYEDLIVYAIDWCAYLDSNWTALINNDWEIHKRCEIGDQQTYYLVYQPKDMLTGERLINFAQEEVWMHITYYPTMIDASLQ